MSIALFSIEKLTFPGNPPAWEAQPNIPGYFLKSTAPDNVEESKQTQAVPNQKMVEATIKQIARDIYDSSKTCSAEKTPEVIFAIHGYNTPINGIKAWYQSIFEYINKDDQIKTHNNLIFIGYRWSSEQVFTEKFSRALNAMPIVPLVVLFGGGLAGLVAIAANFFIQNSYFDLFADLSLVFVISLASMMLALVFLRRLVYFRDQYRATNFGVPDLVDFIQKLDRSIFEVTKEALNPEDDSEVLQWWNENRRVKLNFLGHSMGGFVVTNTVRVLSDAFYSHSAEDNPETLIGNVFCLGRLILASPDIPVMTILSGRANFLASSLRRFREAYLFSNEGDLALRLASTTANYFTFPSGIRESGYRLGNVAIKAEGKYGVINLDTLKQIYDSKGATVDIPVTALEQLFVTNLGAETKSDASLASMGEDRFGSSVEKLSVADLFTFFDCTDYRDLTDTNPQIKGVLSAAKGTPLKILDYIPLLWDYTHGRIDVHGGYFQGKFSQQIIYRLLFLGFGGLLDSFQAGDRERALQSLSMVCDSTKGYCPPMVQGMPEGIKIILSPFRYYVDVKGVDFRAMRKKMLDKIKD
jgi:hypothetical protein